MDADELLTEGAFRVFRPLNSHGVLHRLMGEVM
jgi:hypothetical protein